ncbi:hypothetical protein D3C72_1572150 [compost metagenome]
MRGRRVRFGQVRHVVFGDGPACARCAAAQRGPHPAGRRGRAGLHAGAAARVARHPDVHGVPGAHDGAEPRAHGGLADRRGAAHPQRHGRSRPQAQDPGHAGIGAPARRGAHLPVVSAPAVRRAAPAHRHLHGADPESQAADRRRAHHRAGCDDAKADPGADPGAAALAQHGGAVHHARLRRGGRDRRPHCGDESGKAG